MEDVSDRMRSVRSVPKLIHHSLMPANNIQEASDVSGGHSKKHIVRRFWLREAVISSFRISRLFALSFITAIKFLSMATSYVVLAHSGAHLPDKLRRFRDSA